jgi:gamma-glutamylcyclotransferase (GGCT)/AIG2-like uncharacterized protein YtfP
MERLFIYGTLAPGRSNEHKLNDIKGTWEESIVKGKLHKEGWGQNYGYPGIILDDNGDDVKGFLFSSNELYKKWDELDALEGEEYRRVLATVYLDNGLKVKAYIYELNKK